jgi:hypothetical protein
MLCQYANLLGIPHQGVHKYRIAGLAFVDVFLTFLGSLLIAIWLRKPFLPVFLFFFILGIFLHRLFCVKTTLDTLLFSSFR